METAQAASQRQRSVRERRRERLKAWLCAASSCGRTSQRLLRGPCDCVLGEKYSRGVADMAYRWIGTANGVAVSETDARNKKQVKRAGDGSSSLASERDRCY